MRRIPKRKLITVNEIRATPAKRQGASIGCPITTGIFALIAARAAGEDEADGKKKVTPYWRALKAQGEVNPKCPGGPEAQRARLEAEGHTVVTRGKSLFVQDYESRLAQL